MPHVTGSSMIEEVEGRVIGAFTYPFEFWTRDGKRQVARGHFENDSQAEAWVKEHKPDEYKAGLEMRRFD